MSGGVGVDLSVSFEYWISKHANFGSRMSCTVEEFIWMVGITCFLMILEHAVGAWINSSSASTNLNYVAGFVRF